MDSKEVKFRILAFFSLFSISSILIIAICAFIVFLSQLGFIDKCGRVNLIANEVISNQTGIPLEEIEEFEGVDHHEKLGICK